MSSSFESPCSLRVATREGAERHETPERVYLVTHATRSGAWRDRVQRNDVARHPSRQPPSARARPCPWRLPRRWQITSYMNHHLLLLSRVSRSRSLSLSLSTTIRGLSTAALARPLQKSSGMAPKRKRTLAATAVDSTMPESEVPVTGSAMVSTPEEAQAFMRRVSTRTKKKVVYTEEPVEEMNHVDDAFEGPLTDLEDDAVEDKSPRKKRKRRAKVVEPVVYDIPPVESKTTTFKGASEVSIGNHLLIPSSRTPWVCVLEHRAPCAQARPCFLLSHMPHRYHSQTRVRNGALQGARQEEC